MDNNVKIISQDKNIVTPPVVGSMHKEIGPIGATAEIRASGVEAPHPLPSEIKDIGAEVKDDKPFLTPEHVGIVEHAGASVPVPITASNSTQSSLTKKEIKDISIGSSRRWWEVLLDKIFKSARLKERTA